MPYIKEADRTKFISMLSHCPPIETKGELEYVIFWMMKQYMSSKEKRYTTLHDCTYAAMHCADEFRRRFLDVREDQAKNENGDV
jgi:hypothetical protein